MTLRFLLPALLLTGCFTKAGSGDIVLTDAHNYSYVVDIEFQTANLAAGENSTIRWGDLTTDMRGNPVSGGGEAELVRLVELSLTQDEVEAAVEAGTLTQRDIISPWEWTNSEGADTCLMTDFSVTGNAFDPADEELGFVPRAGDSSWVLSLWRNNEALGAAEILSSVFLVPDEASSTTEFAFANDSASLGFTVDLHSQEPLTVAANATKFSVNWDGVTTTASGKEFDPLLATEFLVAHVTDVSDVTTLEGQFLTTLDNADTWLVNVYGVTEIVDLGQAQNPLDSSFFEGFTTDGIWILAILDPSGNEPAPFFLTVVTVE